MSFLLDTVKQFFNSLLESLGLGSFTHKSTSILLLGLDNAGKTTLLHRMSTHGRELRAFPPTDRPRQDTFECGNVHFRAFDLGGHEAVRHLWEDYVRSHISAVVFLVDAADEERLEEAGFELDALLTGGLGQGKTLSRSVISNNTLSLANGEGDSPNLNNDNGGVTDRTQNGYDGQDEEDENDVSNLSVAILLNKCDLETAVDTDTVLEKMDFQHVQFIHGAEKLKVFRISVLEGTGYHDAFKWIGSKCQQ